MWSSILAGEVGGTIVFGIISPHISVEIFKKTMTRALNFRSFWFKMIGESKYVEERYQLLVIITRKTWK